MTHKVFRRDPVPVNVILLVTAAVVGVVLVGFVWWKSRRREWLVEREELEVEAEEAGEMRMPVVGGEGGG